MGEKLLLVLAMERQRNSGLGPQTTDPHLYRQRCVVTFCAKLSGQRHQIAPNTYAEAAVTEEAASCQDAAATQDNAKRCRAHVYSKGPATTAQMQSWRARNAPLQKLCIRFCMSLKFVRARHSPSSSSFFFFPSSISFLVSLFLFLCIPVSSF